MGNWQSRERKAEGLQLSARWNPELILLGNSLPNCIEWVKKKKCVRKMQRRGQGKNGLNFRA